MYSSTNRMCRAIDERDRADKITDILLQKQLEQIDKVQKSFVKEVTAQQNLTRLRFDDKMMRTENGYAKLWGSKNMTNIWLDLNQDMTRAYSSAGSLGGRRSSQKRPKPLLARGKTELGTSSTVGANKTEDCTVPKTTETESPSERAEIRRSNTARPAFQRNITFVNSRTLRTDLGDNPKITPIRINGLKASEHCTQGKAEPGAGNQRRQNYNLQNHCWGSKFFSDRRTPRRHNRSRRYSRIGSPTKNFLGGVDVSDCFANVSLSNNTDNYETKIKDFCDSLKHLILTTTNDK